jgi:hypothetical protein
VLYYKTLKEKRYQLKFKCQPVNLDYIEKAPYKSVNEVTVDASTQEIFEFFEKGESWVNWISFISKVEWTSPKPFGSDTTRNVTLNGIKVDEVFVVWDNGKRLSFYFATTSVPFVKSLLEDYQLLEVNTRKTKIIHTVAFEPHFLTKIVGSVMHKQMGNTFNNAISDLPNHFNEYKI